MSNLPYGTDLSVELVVNMVVSRRQDFFSHITKSTGVPNNINGGSILLKCPSKP